FVLKKSLELGLQPIVIINKIDKDAARPMEVVDMVFDLFVALGATDEQCDFPYVFAIARDGVAKKTLEDPSTDLSPLFDLIMEKVEVAEQNTEAAFSMQPSSLAYDDFVGRMAVGRVYEGKAIVGQSVFVKKEDGSTRPEKIYCEPCYQESLV
ncbi:MAG: translational GTPase TypA, partial [Candidatus Peribacteraceae bacterium]|nr:translational GTPase TypA [Candidatus Peribacteraceae bacterium]